MNVHTVIFGVLGGLGLFLFGMGLMSDGLKAVAGNKLKSILAKLTEQRIVAVLLGAVVTILVTSSSASTVMTVGFVNAGLLSLSQALCVVLGANVGTTATAWLVSIFGFGGFQITAYALPAIGVGFFMATLSKTQRTKNIGRIITGFGMLFVGVNFMQEAFEPIRGSESAQALLIGIAGYPLLAVLAGTILTVLLQSSSAAIMVIQVLALQGAFGTDWSVVMNLVIPFILGDNIGTTITAQLASARASRNARRTAMGHTIFNLIGVAYILPFVWSGAFSNLVAWITPWEITSRTVMAEMAAAHTTFNVLNTMVFIPLIGVLELIVVRLLPVKEEEAEAKSVALEKHLLDTPTIAFGQVTLELLRMAKIAEKAVTRAVVGLVEDDGKELDYVRRREEQTDEFQYEITAYLTELSRRPLSDDLSEEIPVLMHTVNDLERVGDHAVNIAEIADRKIQQKLVFSDEALDEAKQLLDYLTAMFEKTIIALESKDRDAAQAALEIEEQLNTMQVELRKNHCRRMGENGCSAEAGLIFIDLVDNVEKIGDHLTNIAQSVIGGLQWESHEPSPALLK
ncbi:MAG: Na/Pi cotransporter family protein [Candidatus Hydrogenedentota bacterium]